MNDNEDQSVFCISDRVRMRVRVYKSGRTHFRCSQCGQSAFHRERKPVKPEGYQRGRPARELNHAKASQMLERLPLVEVANMMGVHRSLLYYRVRNGGIIVPSFRARRSRQQTSLLYWPYMVADDPRYDGLVRVVNEAVPRTLAAEVRADVCQDIMVSVLTGQIQEGEIAKAVKAHITRHYRLFSVRDHRTVSLDIQTWNDGGNRTIMSTLVG